MKIPVLIFSITAVFLSVLLTNCGNYITPVVIINNSDADIYFDSDCTIYSDEFDSKSFIWKNIASPKNGAIIINLSGSTPVLPDTAREKYQELVEKNLRSGHHEAVVFTVNNSRYRLSAGEIADLIMTKSSFRHDKRSVSDSKYFGYYIDVTDIISAVAAGEI